MLSKYIQALLVVMGYFTFACAADAPCDGKPFAGGHECTDQKGKWVMEYEWCTENRFFQDEGISGVQCIKPGYAFDTEAECREKCKEEIVDLPESEED